MFADSQYADFEKKCRYADIADINKYRHALT